MARRSSGNGEEPHAHQESRTEQEPKAEKKLKSCFFIAPIGEAGSDVRRRSDQIFKHILAPLCKELGYVCMRADQLPEAGMITEQIVKRLMNDDLVVADLSGHNPNVFYELCLRHVVRKPLIQLIGVGERIPFDVAGMRTVPLDVRDLDSVADARQAIIDQIKSFESGDLVLSTPISTALDLQFLSTSSDPEQQSLAELTAMVKEVRAAVMGRPTSSVLPLRASGRYVSSEEHESSKTALKSSLIQRLLFLIPAGTPVTTDDERGRFTVCTTDRSVIDAVMADPIVVDLLDFIGAEISFVPGERTVTR